MNHKIIFAEHIVCVFPENIISCFDVSANDVSEEFAEMLHIDFIVNNALLVLLYAYLHTKILYLQICIDKYYQVC